MNHPLNLATISEIYEHADLVYPREACGLVIDHLGAQLVFWCRNVSPKPKFAFQVHPGDARAALECGKPLALYHSHTNGFTDFSLGDLNQMSKTKIPWFLVNPGERVEKYRGQ